MISPSYTINGSNKKESDKFISSLSIKVLLILSIATSIDALSVGLNLSLLNVSIMIPAVVTGVITFSLSLGEASARASGADLGAS